MDGFVDVSALLRSGVYALSHRGKVVYIGRSGVLLDRLHAHMRHAQRATQGRTPSKTLVRRIVFDAMHIRACHPDNAAALERQLIAQHNPRYNDLLRSGEPLELNIGGKTMVLRPKPQTNGLRRF